MYMRTHANTTSSAHIQFFKVSHAFCYLEGKVVNIFGKQTSGVGQVVYVDAALLQCSALLRTAHVHKIGVPPCLHEDLVLSGDGMWVGDGCE